MIIVIRNASGFELFLAVSAGEKSIRFRIYSEPPEGVSRIHRLRNGEPFGMDDCPEGIGVRVDVTNARLSLRVARHREMIDSLDENNEIDGDETFIEFTLRLLN
jgi:hypothetical protein